MCIRDSARAEIGSTELYDLVDKRIVPELSHIKGVANVDPVSYTHLDVYKRQPYRFISHHYIDGEHRYLGAGGYYYEVHP